MRKLCNGHTNAKKLISNFFLFYIILFNSSESQSEQTRSSSSENLPFSISRLLSKPFENNNHINSNNNNSSNGSNKSASDPDIASEHDLAAYKLATSLASSTYGSAATALYTYPHLYPSAAAAAAGHVLRVPPQRTPLTWALPPLHHAALAHQAVKDRLAGEQNTRLHVFEQLFVLMIFNLFFSSSFC